MFADAGATSRVTSRYDSQREIDTMNAMLAALPSAVSRRIESVFCDSKACAVYSVELSDNASELIGELIDDAFLKVSDGHNGVILYGSNGTEHFLAPNWKGDW